jgi:hypothetical protein
MSTTFQSKSFSLDLGDIKLAPKVDEKLKECCDTLELMSPESREKCLETLRVSLAALNGLLDPCLYIDFADLSFIFKGSGLMGGLIYHGEGIGWMLHT